MEAKFENSIERYIKGEMDAKESANFETRLESNSELKEEYKASLLAYQLITEAGRLQIKNDLESIENEMDQNLGDRKVIPLWVKRSIPIAAILIVFFGVYQFGILNSSLSSVEVYDRYFESYTEPDVMRSPGPEELINWEQAIEFYRDKEYSKAQNYFENAGEEVPFYLTSFYSGVCALSKEHPDPEKAVIHFDNVLGSDNDFTQQALWYKGLALLNSDSTTEAMVIFERISKEKSYNYKLAEEIIGLKIGN